MALVATLDEFKLRLRYGTGTSEDDKLTDVLTAASEWIEWRIGGPLAITQITEIAYTKGWSMVPRKAPLVDVVSITPERSSTALSSTTYRADTTNKLIRFYDGTAPGWYDLVYHAGLATVGSKEKMAGLELATHLLGPQNGSGARGRTEELLANLPGYAVPNRVEELLATTPVMGFA